MAGRAPTDVKGTKPLRAIDSHFHWYPRSHFERMARRLDEPRTERVGEGYRYSFNGGRNHIPMPPVWFDLDAGLAASDAATGVPTSVVATTGVLSGLMDQLPVADAVPAAVEYNEEVAKAQRTYAGRFYGTAAVPLQETGEALSILDHAVRDLDLRAVNLPPLTAGEPVDAARLDPFYARVAELGVPLVVHPTDITFGEVLAGYDGALQRTIGRLLDSSVTVLRLIFSGVLDRHPDLRIIHTHAGGLLPYQAGRIDKNARLSDLRRPPSAYLKELYVDTVAPQAMTIETAVRFYGADRVLYGTDYPCWHPEKACGVIEEAELTPDQRTAILSRNAGAVIDLSPPAR